MRSDYIEVYEAKDGWRWRRKAANHKVISTGEQHRDARDARRAATRANPDVMDVRLLTS